MDGGQRPGAKLREVFSADTRALAVLRMGTALLILFDLATRAPHIGVNYTDAGVMPRSLIQAIVATSASPLNLYALGGSAGFVGFLFAVQAGFAVALLLGYRTRLATFGCYVLVTSLGLRNPAVLNGGDVVLRQTLFWSLFLPLGARWSLDGRGREPVTSVFSMGSIALLLQVSFVYFFAAILKAKSGPMWTTDGTAIFYALHEGMYSRPLADLLLGFPAVLPLLTWSVLLFELLVPLLLFSPVWTGPVRTLGVVGVWLLHLGLGASIELGLFPWLSAIVIAVFLPAWFWDRALPRSRRAAGEGPAAAPAARPPLFGMSETGRLGRVDAALLAAALALVVLMNVDSVDSDFEMTPVDFVKAFGMEQGWDMYTRLGDVDFRFELRGRLADGAWVDLDMPGRGPRWEDVRSLHRSYRFRSYIETFPNAWGQRESYGRWMCEQWNAEAPAEKRLVFLESHHVMRRIRPGQPLSPPHRETLFRHHC